MKMKWSGVFKVFTVMYFTITTMKAFNTFVEPIKQLLSVLNSPLMVTTMVCWNFDDKLIFARNFLDYKNKNNYQFAITDVKIDNFPNVQEEHQHLIIVDLRCNQTSTFLRQIGMKLTHRFKWIAIDNSHDTDDIILITFRNLPVLPNSEIFCISRVDPVDGFIIRQVYRISMATSLETDLFGIYRDGKFLEYRGKQAATEQRRNLNQTLLRATLVVTNNDTLNHLEDYGDKHIDTISKVSYFLTNLLISYVNATIQYTFVNSWGYMNSETGNWSGMIGDLVDNRSDIGASALFFTSDRIQYIEYIVMPTPTRSKFVLRSPKLSYTDNVFILPFDTMVWYSLFGFMLTISMCLLFTVCIERKIYLKKKYIDESDDSAVLHASPMEVFFVVFGAACQQGSSATPRSVTARIIMMITFTTLMFLYTSYSANIVALLQSPSNKINTLEDLLNSRLILGADDTVFNHYYFSHASEPIRKKIYEQKILNKNGTANFLSLKEGVDNIRKGLYAFHMETGSGYKVISETFLEDEKCGLKEIQYLQVLDPWYAIRKNSSYKEVFKVGMMRIREYGLQERENSRLYTKKPDCHGGGGGKFITASLVDIGPALYVLLWGLFLSCLTFILEITYKRIVSLKLRFLD